MPAVASRPATLSGLVFPHKGDATGLLEAAVMVIAGSALLTLSAKAQVPFYPVPMTLQPLAVLVIGAALGMRLGMMTVMLYLMEGLAGLPVFAGAGAGPAYLMGPTGGYLAGFVLAAGLVGYLAERGFDHTIPRMALAMTLGTVMIYLPGVAWLTSLIGMEKAVQFGLLPFLPGDAVKISIAALAFPALWRLLDRR